MLKCYENRPDCFAVNLDGKCEMLESYVRNDGPLGKTRRYGTKFKGHCPFAKGILEAGGTYRYLCDKYPIDSDPEDRK